ncbi:MULTISPECIES: ATP-grasp domain-containing protein [unclassified Streptomyces]|uniref:ATP-grasp domain-containing protein n=1 Tax=unclassified Streptomyces TaxID=2593676 RepID=UPI00344EFF16
MHSRTERTPEAVRRPAVIVMSDLVVLARQSRLIEEIVARDLVPLVLVGPDTPMDRLRAHMADPTHPLSVLSELVQVPDPAVDTVLCAVQDWVREYEVKASVCCGEVFVDPAGALNDLLRLPGPGGWASRVCRDKIMQRTALDAFSPRWRAVAPAERSRAEPPGYPAVVKPAGRMYSSGVRRVDDAGQLRAALQEYGPEEFVLLEELVEGPEFSVEALVYDGAVLWSGITAKRTNEDGGHFFTELGHTCPAPGLTAAEESALTRANAGVLAAVGLRHGITHAEFRLSGGRAVLMEVAARLPGDAITMLWHLATGAPLEPAIVDLALGAKPDYPEPVRRAAQRYLDHESGTLSEVRTAPGGPDVSWIPCDGRWPATEATGADAPARHTAVLVTRAVGELLGEQVDSVARAVSVVGDAPLTADIDAPGRQWASSVRVTTRPPTAAAGDR